MTGTTINVSEKTMSALKRYKEEKDLGSMSKAVENLLESEGKRRNKDWFSSEGGRDLSNEER